MRFFSNEAKENADDEPAPDHDRDQAGAEGLPAPVPQQRIGSPWSDTPGAGNTTDPADQDDTEESRRDSGEMLRSDDSEVRHDGDDLVRDSDAPHAGDQDELDLPLDDRSAGGSHRAGAFGEPAGDGPAAEQTGGTTTAYGPDGSVTTVGDDEAGSTSDRAPAWDPAADRPVDSSEATAEPAEAQSAGTGERRDDEPVLDDAAPVVATAPVVTPTSDTTMPAEDASPAAESGRDASGTDATGPATSGAEEDAADATPAVAAVPVGAGGATTTPEAAKPDVSAAPVGDRLFPGGDSYDDRLRDIALTFVDSPQEATEQAGALVDEAIEKLTSALKGQKDALAGEGDDTEKLRVRLRGYREILKRLTAL